MHATRTTRPPATSEERAHFTFWSLGATANRAGLDGLGLARPRDEMLPISPPVAERIRRLPEAVLLTVGYYAGRAPLVGNLLRRAD